MEANAKRTLVKSAPELWELADDQARMEAWMAGLTNELGSVPIEIVRREPETALTWRSANGTNAQISIELAESGFGTAVTIIAQHSRPDPAQAIQALEGLLDELGSPERRPFGGG